MASIKTKLASLNLGIAALITAVLGLFLWMVADLSEDLSRARMDPPRTEDALANLDGQVTEVTLALWTLSSAVDGHELRLHADAVDAALGVLREGIDILSTTLSPGGAEQLSDGVERIADGAKTLAQARRALLDANRIRGETVPLLADMLFDQARTEDDRRTVSALMANLDTVLEGDSSLKETLPRACDDLTGSAKSPPCQVLDEILTSALLPRAGEAALRVAVANVADHLRAFRTALSQPRAALEGARTSALASWSDRLVMLTSAMTVALVLAMPLFFVSQWVQEVQIVRRIEVMRRGMVDWLKGRAPVIPNQGEDELAQMETYLTRFKETIERRDAVLKATSEGLERARENLRTILSTTPTGILLADLSQRAILETNGAAERLLDFDTAIESYETLRRTLLTQDPWSEILTRVAGGDRVENAEVALTPGRGKARRSLGETGPRTGGDVTKTPFEEQSSWLLVSAREVTFDGERRALIGLADITRQKVLEAELRERAIRDPLTGLYNRRHFDALALQALKRFRRDGEPVSVVMMDIDHFKAINDTHGHVNGDRALRRLADIIRDSIREADTPGRLGGEEFGLLLPGVDLTGARVFAERLRRAVAEATVRLPQDRTLSMTVSLGIAQIDLEDTLERVVSRADAALYTAKRDGRDRVMDQRDARPPGLAPGLTPGIAPVDGTR
ncbi:MAG: GGDEF domain-containing protein [Rhodospirillum sp.]|nr:GGDEF domain-containing protein [Rhodospirillum sp.]